MLQTVQKTTTTIYLWTDSAKKQQTIYIWTDSAKKQQTIYIWTDSAKKQQTIYIWTDSAKKTALEHLQCSRQCKKQQQQFTYGQYIFTDCTEDNVQNTYIYSVHIMYYKDTLNLLHLLTCYITHGLPLSHCRVLSSIYCSPSDSYFTEPCRVF